MSKGRQELQKVKKTLLLPSLNQSLTITHSGDVFQGGGLSSLCLMGDFLCLLLDFLILVAA